MCESGGTDIFIGESVTLKCEVRDGTKDWRYKWHRDGQNFTKYRTGEIYKISSATVLDIGRYSCKGRNRNQNIFSDMSNDLLISVSGRNMKSIKLIYLSVV